MVWTFLNKTGGAPISGRCVAQGDSVSENTYHIELGLPLIGENEVLQVLIRMSEPCELLTHGKNQPYEASHNTAIEGVSKFVYDGAHQREYLSPGGQTILTATRRVASESPLYAEAAWRIYKLPNILNSGRTDVLFTEESPQNAETPLDVREESDDILPFFDLEGLKEFIQDSGHSLTDAQALDVIKLVSRRRGQILPIEFYELFAAFSIRESEGSEPI